METAAEARSAFMTLKLLAIALGAGAVAALMGGKLYTISSDLAFHYDLARQIQAVWRWPAGHPITSGMEGYPPLGHYLAAVAGLPFHSALLGLNLVAVVAAFGCYLILAETITAGSLLGAGVALAVAAVVLAYGRTQYAVIGYEVLYSFFFAQMVGECVFLGFVLWLCRTRRSWKARLAVSAVAAFAGNWIYPLSAVQMALAYMSLEAILLLRGVRVSRRFRPIQALPLALGVVILPPLVAANPEFWIMVQISYNDGGLGLLAFERLVPELAALLTVLAIGLGVFAPDGERWRRGTLVLAAASLATATGALAQTAALELFHAGSPYAIKKYGFAVVTLLAFSLGALAATAIEGRGVRRAWAPAALGLPVLFAVAVTLGAPNHPPQGLRPFIKYQKGLQRIVRDPAFPADAWGRTASHDDRFDWMLNHVVTMGDLRMPLYRSIAATRSDLDPAKPLAAPYLVTGEPKADFASLCVRRFAADPALMFVDLSCDRAHAVRPISLPTNLALSALQTLPRYFAKGWSGKDARGVWSDGKQAELAMHFDAPPPEIKVALDLTPFMPRPAYVQHVIVRAGPAEVARWVFDATSPAGRREAEIPRELLQNGDLHLELDLPDAVSPASQGVSPDGRVLGVFVSGLSVSKGGGLAAGDSVSFAALADRPDALQSGWSMAEPAGVWTDGHHAVLAVALAPPGPATLVFDGNAYLPRPGYVQHVIVAVGGRRLASWTFDSRSASGPRRVSVPADLIGDGKIALDFDLPDATSPAIQHVSADARVLGYFIKSFSVAK